MVLLIDDERTVEFIEKTYGLVPSRIARTFSEGIQALKESRWDILLLDHDLACYDEEGNELTGYKVLLFLEENPEFMPKQVKIITSNASARIKINLALEAIKKRMNDDTNLPK